MSTGLIEEATRFRVCVLIEHDRHGLGIPAENERMCVMNFFLEILIGWRHFAQPGDLRLELRNTAVSFLPIALFERNPIYCIKSGIWPET